MGEMTSKTEATAPVRRLCFLPAGLTNKEAAEGATAYEAEREGVKYRVVGRIVDPMSGSRRKFRAYRVGEGGRLLPVREGGALNLLKWAKEECELDLADVIARREIDEAAEWQATPAYRHFARATQLAGGYRGALDRLHAEAAAEHRERFGLTADDRLSMTVTPSGSRKIAAHIEARPTTSPQRAEQLVGRTLRAEAPPAPIREALDRVAVAAYEAVEAAIEAASSTPAAGPDPATDDDSNELLDRIVRRAQYTALRAMLDVLDGWIEGAAENHEAMSHRDSDCCRDFAPADIRRMVNDVAAELRVPAPYVPEPDVGPRFAVGDRVYPRTIGGEVVTVERVAVIEGSAGRQQFWATGEHIARHSDEYRLVEIAAGRA